MTDPRACPYSGRSILSCKVSDLCDCFDFPSFDAKAAEAIARREALAERRQDGAR